MLVNRQLYQRYMDDPLPLMMTTIAGAIELLYHDRDLAAGETVLLAASRALQDRAEQMTGAGPH